MSNVKNIFERGANLDVSYQEYAQDLLSRGKSRFLSQFNRSTLLNELMDAISAESQELFQASYDCLDKRTVSKAAGVNLDALGEIVGQARNLMNSSLLNWLTSDADGKAPDYSLAWVDGAPLFGNRQVDDPEYRKLILGKIFRNHVVGASLPEARYFVQLLTGSKVSFVKTGLLEVCLAIPFGLDPQTLSLIVSTIKNQAVDYSYFIPIPPAVKLNTDQLYLVVTDGQGNGASFAPDMSSGRPDFAMATVTIHNLA